MKHGTPKRPKNVPFGARWVDPMWQYGTEDARGVAHGLWCGWKKKGALAYVAQLDAGVLHGPSVEFHPDGGMARRATYAKGELVGIEEFFAPTAKSDEPFPAEKPVARVVVDHGPRPGTPPKKRFFLADGAECNEHGTPLSALFCEAPFLVREAEQFAKQTMNLFVKHRLKVAPSAAARAKAARQPGLARDVSALWGTKARGDFKLALSLVERARVPRHLGDFGPEPVATLAAQAAGATVESIVARGQRSVGALPIAALFGGLVPVGTSGGGDVFALSVFDDGDAFVYSWAPEREELTVEADDFATFLVGTAAREAEKGGMLTPRVRAHLAKLLGGHVRHTSLGDVRWPAAPFALGETRAQERHRRAAWLVAALAGEPLDTILERFESQGARPLDAALAQRLGRPDDLAPPDLVYALFRSAFAFDPRLPALCELADKSKSSLVTSAAALVRALERRPSLGKVKELQSLRRALKGTLFGAPAHSMIPSSPQRAAG